MSGLIIAAPDVAFVSSQIPRQQFPTLTYLGDLARDAEAGLVAGTGAPVVTPATPTLATVVDDPDMGLSWQPQAGQSPAYYAMDGQLPVDEFSIAFGVKSNHDSSEGFSNQAIVCLGLNTSRVCLKLDGNFLEVQFGHQQDPDYDGFHSWSAFVEVDTGAYAFLANALIFPRATLKAGELGLWLGDTQVAATSGVVPPDAWGSTTRGDGVVVAGQDGVASTELTVGAGVIDSVVRLPNKRFYTTRRRSTSTVTTTPTGQTMQSLGGMLPGLMNFALGQPTTVNEAAVANNARLGWPHNGVEVGLGTGTPIRLNGTTDATYPHLGATGDQVFNFEMWDNSIDDYMRMVGPNGTILVGTGEVPAAFRTDPSSGPQPFGPSDLATRRVWDNDYAPGPPDASKITEFGKCHANFIARAIDRGAPVKWCNYAEEPNVDSGFGFSPSDPAPFLPVFAAISGAVDALNLGVKICGPGVVHWVTSNTTWRAWVTALINYCGANSVRLDGISSHAYDGLACEAAEVRLFIDRLATAAGLGSLDRLNKETSDQIEDVTGVPWVQPPRDGPAQMPPSPFPLDALRDCRAAGWNMRSAILEQLAGTVFQGLGDPSSQICPMYDNATGVQTAVANVFAMLLPMIGLPVVESSWASRDPGLEQLWALDTPNGQLHGAFGSQHYSPFPYSGFPTLVTLPAGYNANGTPYEVQLIDREHSSSFDAGADHAELETVDVGTVQNGVVGIRLPQNGAVKLVVG